MTSRVCVIGNTNLDLVMGLLPVWPEAGTETFLERSDFRAGGSAANTAIVLQSLDCESGLISALGSDVLGDVLAAGFSGRLQRIVRVQGQTGVSVGVLHPGAVRSFLSFNGHLDAMDLPMILAALADWPLDGALVLVSGAFAMPGLLADQDALLDHLRLAGAHVAIDPGWPGAGWLPAVRRRVEGWVRRVDHVLMKDKEIMGLTGAPTLTDMGASFAIATGGVLTLFIAAPPNGSSVWVRVVDEVSGAVFEQEISADLPAATQFLSPRLFLNTGATAAAVAYDCAGVYLETDF